MVFFAVIITPVTCILDIESYDHRIIQVQKDVMKSLVQIAVRGTLKSELVAQICSGLLMLRPVRSWKSPFFTIFWGKLPLCFTVLLGIFFSSYPINASFSNIHPLSLILSPHTAVKSLGPSSLLISLQTQGTCCQVPPYSHLFSRLNKPWSLSLFSQGKVPWAATDHGLIQSNHPTIYYTPLVLHSFRPWYLILDVNVFCRG